MKHRSLQVLVTAFCALSLGLETADAEVSAEVTRGVTAAVTIVAPTFAPTFATTFATTVATTTAPTTATSVQRAASAHAAELPSDCPAAAKEPTAEQMAEVAKHAADRGFLWRIAKGGHTSYLYGTLHVARLEWIVPGRQVAVALKSTDEIALEMDPLDPAVTSALSVAMKPTDEAPLPPALAARLAAQVRAACLPESINTQYSPEMLAMSLAIVAGRRDGLEPQYGIDLSLAYFAHQVHRPVRSLETPELQMAVIKGGDADETRQSIAQSLDELESGRTREQLLRIADIWSAGRFDELTHYADWCGCLDSEVERALMRRALDDRNPGLADGIAALHDGGRNVFAAVGSLHMIGPLGLPALLRARGFEVTRIAFKP